MRHIKPSSMGVSLVVILPLLWKGITSQIIYPPGYSIQVSSGVSVQEGLCVTIPCTFTAGGRNTFSNSFGYWIRMPHYSGYIVATNNKSSVVKKKNFHLRGNPDTGDCTLTITDAGKQDEGEYYYRFEESKNSPVRYNYHREMTITITVPGPPIRITWGMNGKTDKKSDVIKVAEGSSVTLRCSVQSDRTRNMTWKDGKNNVLQTGAGKDLELRLENMTMNHIGTYTCSWNWNKSLINSENINVTVQYTPRNMKITIRSSTGEERPINSQVDINQNETLTLVCRADGNPPVTVVWMREENDTDTSKIISSKLSAVINVTDSEAGVYRCSAWNAVGFKEQRFRVGKKTDYADELNETQDTNLFGGIAIGFICGFSIATLIILLYKLYTRKKITKKNTDVSASGMSAGAESPKDDIYINTSGPDPVAEEATYDRVQVDSSGAGQNEDALLYSTVNFAAKRSKVPSSQPETEYAEVHVK